MRAPGRTCGAPVLAEVAGTRGENVTAAGRTTLPGKSTGRPCSANACAAPWSGVTARAGCTTDGLRPWNRSGNPRHRRRRTGSGRTGGHARAGGGGDHLSERPGHATMAQRERLGVAVGRRDPGRTPSLTSTGRVQGRGGVRAGWLKGGCRRARPGVVPPRSTAGSCSRRHLRRCTAGPRPSLPAHRVSPRWRRARCPPPRPADPPGCPLPRGARSPPRRFRARLAYASGHAAWLRRPGGQRADGQGRVRGDQGPSGPESNMYSINWLGWSFARRPAGTTGGGGSHARVAGQPAPTGGI